MIVKHKLLIDADCPMCNLYGWCFTKAGLVDHHTILPYQQVSGRIAQQVDMDKARNKIALYDEVSEHTVYGLDAFIRILAQGRPHLRAVLRSFPVYSILRMLYAFISFNRKVIYPTPTDSRFRVCLPDLNKTYRVAYLVAATCVTSVIVSLYTRQLGGIFAWVHPWWCALLVCTGQLLWQGICISVATQDIGKRLDYLGNISTIALVEAFGLLIILLVHHIMPLGDDLLISGLLFVIGVMLAEHVRRCRILNVRGWLSMTWVGYRFFLLGLVLLAG